MDSNVSNFYILGLPRSRSLWFSEFFTTNDETCVHEHLSIPGNVPIDGIRGYSDTNPLLTHDYGNSPLLIVERDKKAVIDSILSSFDAPTGIRCWKNTVTNFVTHYRRVLDTVRPKNFWRIDFDKINDELYDISKFLLPDKPVQGHRIEQLKNTVIKTDNRDITKTYAMNDESAALNIAKKYDLLDTARITDYTIANMIINQCWYEVTEDNTTSFTPDIVNEYWMGLYNERELVGCYRFHQINAATWKGHVFMLPKHRKRYSMTGMYTILRWVADNLDCEKIVVDVPEKFKNVIAFLESFDFVHEGINRQSYSKDGQLWDLHNYGLTRNEILERI